MLSIFTNTIEGLVEATVNTIKAPIGAALLPLDNGKTLNDAVEGVTEGLEKVGKSDDS